MLYEIATKIYHKKKLLIEYVLIPIRPDHLDSRSLYSKHFGLKFQTEDILLMKSIEWSCRMEDVS